MLALIKTYGDDIIYIVNKEDDGNKQTIIKVANKNCIRYNKHKKIKDLGAFNSPRELEKAIRDYMYLDKETSALWPDEWVAARFEVETAMELPRRIKL